MPKSQKPKKNRLDPTTKALFELTECALHQHFADPDNLVAYAAKVLPLTTTDHTGRVSIAVLDTWQFESDGSLTLRALADAEHFTVQLEHPDFRFEVVANYELAAAAMRTAAVAALEGNRQEIRHAAHAWVHDQIEADLEVDFLFPPDVVPDVPGVPDFRGVPGGADEPPAATEADARAIAGLARDLAANMARIGAFAMPPALEPWFESNPQTLWPVLDGLVAACQARVRDDGVIAAYHWLLLTQLELIRYRQERGWDWAKRMLDEYQQRLIELGRERTIAQDDWFPLAGMLSQAKIPVTDAMSEALAAAGLTTSDTQGNELGLMRELIDELATEARGPFEVLEAFSEVGAVVPPAIRSFLAQELAMSPHRVLRDAVPLLLLDPDSTVRRTTATALEQIAAPDTLSPEALRRTIAMRNWIPEPDRPAVDRAIRMARSKGVDCAQWPSSGEVAIFGSSIDGSGAQSVIAANRGGRNRFLAGVLLKQEYGVRDTWCDHEQSRREINQILRSVGHETGSTEIERAFMDIAVQHAIGVGLAEGHVPSATLLDVAESVGATDWQDRRLDTSAEVSRLFNTLEPEDRSEEAIVKSLQRSGNWMAREPIAESWYEDDAAVRELIARRPRSSKAAMARLVLTESLEHRRVVWAERFLLLALWAQATKQRAQQARWRDFIVLAHELLDTRPLLDIPLMVGVSEKSVVIARSGAW